MEIVRVQIADYIGIGESLERIQHKADAAAEQAATGDSWMVNDDFGWLLSTVEALQDRCLDIHLEYSNRLLEGMVERLERDSKGSGVRWDRVRAEIAIIADGINSEIANRLFFFLPPYRAHYYRIEVDVPSDPDATRERINEYPFSPAVAQMFPATDGEVFEAARCFALSRDTACVFHLMRVLEIGLRALARRMQLPRMTDRKQWGQIIQKIEDEVKALQESERKKPTKRGAEKLTFYSEAGKEFTYFKDAWRNHVMHARTTYDMTESARIFAHVNDFMTFLAKRGISQPKLKKHHQSWWTE